MVLAPLPVGVLGLSSVDAQVNSVVDMTTTSLHVPLRTAPAARLAADTRYVLAGFPAALGTAVLCAAGLAAGAGLAVAAVGVPLLIATLGRARGFAAAERTRIATVLGRSVPEPSYRTGTAASPLRRLTVALADPQTWRDVAHAVLRVVPSGLALAVVVAWWAGVIGGLTWALWGWTLPAGPGPAAGARGLSARLEGWAAWTSMHFASRRRAPRTGCTSTTRGRACSPAGRCG